MYSRDATPCDWYSGKRGFVPPARVLAPQAPEEGALGGGEA